MQFIERKTNGRLQLGAGTLYGALVSLKDKGWIVQIENNQSRRKEYKITPLGRSIAEKEYKRLQELTQIALEIIKDGEI